MIPLTVTPDIGRTPWRDLHIAWGEMATIKRVGRLPMGTVQGNSTVTFAIELPDGSTVLAQTTMKNFLGAARILEAADKTGSS